jgi:RNA polymerase sigma factor (sigma-70 family)
MLAPPAANPILHDTMPDDQLMLAYAGGDAAAFDMLYARHESALFRFVRRLLGVRLAAEVDEVFQDTWMRIIAARESFSPQGAAWRTWAFTIAHNLAMDRLRLSGREVAFYAHDEDGDGLEAAQLFSRGLLNDGSTASDTAHPSAEELAFWRAAGRRLLACLDELPDEQRAAFLLQHEDGFTVEALADTLGVGFETVRSRLRYGLKKLRGCMERYLSVLELRA